jgi:hypothetical protein
MLSSVRRCWSPSSPPSSTWSQFSMVSRRHRSGGYVDWNNGRHHHASPVWFTGCPPKNQPVNRSPSLYLPARLSSSSSTSALTEIKNTLSKSLLSLNDEQMIFLLIEYSDKHGDCHVPVGQLSVHREERRRLRVSSELVRWILQQRKQYTRAMSPGGKLSKSFQTRLVILESLGFIWSTREAQWHRSFNQLVEMDNKFQSDNTSSEHHHEEISSSTNNEKTKRRRKLVEIKQEEHPSLYSWVDEQRKAHKAGRLSLERESLLKKIGFVFSLNERRWQENYDKLRAFHTTHGDSRVPVLYDEDPAFGEWVRPCCTCFVNFLIPFSWERGTKTSWDFPNLLFALFWRYPRLLDSGDYTTVEN